MCAVVFHTTVQWATMKMKEFALNYPCFRYAINSFCGELDWMFIALNLYFFTQWEKVAAQEISTAPLTSTDRSIFRWILLPKVHRWVSLLMQLASIAFGKKYLFPALPIGNFYAITLALKTNLHNAWSLNSVDNCSCYAILYACKKIYFYLQKSILCHENIFGGLNVLDNVLLSTTRKPWLKRPLSFLYLVVTNDL